LYVYTKGNNKVEIQGHRGARGNYPENTLSAFRYAIENDVDALELDLQMTKDKEIIIYHDKQIDTTICSHPSARIKDLTLSEILKYDCGSKQNPIFPQQIIVVGERIPSFKELIEMVQNEYYYKSIKMNVEIKTEQNVDTDEEVYEFTNKLIEIIHQYNLQNKITIQSFDTRALEYVKQIDSKIKTSFLIERAQPINDEIIQLAKKLNVQIISPDYHLIDKNIVGKLKQHGFEVLPWTINDVDTLRQHVKYGVNGIITDYPKQMKDYLSQQM
jgi:glycerophosphoryl diester phosphodiesterase